MNKSLCAFAACIVLSSSAMATETITYTYDAKGRLVSTVHSGTVNNGVSSCYGFDNAENRTGVAVTTGGAACAPPTQIVNSYGIPCSSPTIQMGSIPQAGPIAFTWSASNITALCTSSYALTVTNPASGSISGTIGPNSTVSFNYTVTDGHGGTGTGSITYHRN